MGGSARRQIRAIDDEALLAAAAEAIHMRDLLTRLGLAAYGGNYESVRKRLARLQMLDDRFCPQPRRAQQVLRAVTSGELERALASAGSLTGLLRALGLAPSSTAYRELRRRMSDEGLDAGRLRDRARVRGREFTPRIPLAQLLVVGGTTDVRNLKRRLLREGVLPRSCDVCGISEWLGAPAPLEVDHINGDRRDNRLENLRLLCPNCHALTPTWRGRNIGRVVLLPTP